MVNDLNQNIQDLIKVGAKIQKSVEQFNTRSSQLIKQAQKIQAADQAKKQTNINTENTSNDGIIIPNDLFFKVLQNLSYTRAMGLTSTEIYNAMVSIATANKNSSAKAINTTKKNTETTTEKTKKSVIDLLNQYGAKQEANKIKMQTEKKAEETKSKMNSKSEHRSTIDFDENHYNFHDDNYKEENVEDLLAQILANGIINNSLERFFR